MPYPVQHNLNHSALTNRIVTSFVPGCSCKALTRTPKRVRIHISRQETRRYNTLIGQYCHIRIRPDGSFASQDDRFCTDTEIGDRGRYGPQGTAQRNTGRIKPTWWQAPLAKPAAASPRDIKPRLKPRRGLHECCYQPQDSGSHAGPNDQMPEAGGQKRGCQRLHKLSFKPTLAWARENLSAGRSVERVNEWLNAKFAVARRDINHCAATRPSRLVKRSGLSL